MQTKDVLFPTSNNTWQEVVAVNSGRSGFGAARDNPESGEYRTMPEEAICVTSPSATLSLQSTEYSIGS